MRLRSKQIRPHRRYSEKMIEYLRLVRLYAAALATGAFLVLAILSLRPDSVSPAITAGLLAGAAVFVLSSRLAQGEGTTPSAVPAATVRLEQTAEGRQGAARGVARGWFDALAERERVLELRLAIVRDRRLGTAASAES